MLIRYFDIFFHHNLSKIVGELLCLNKKGLHSSYSIYYNNFFHELVGLYEN